MKCIIAKHNSKTLKSSTITQSKPKAFCKGCCKKKPGVLNFITLAYVSSKKMIDIHFCSQGYESSKELAII
jgi:hypothetical protein